MILNHFCSTQEILQYLIIESSAKSRYEAGMSNQEAMIEQAKTAIRRRVTESIRRLTPVILIKELSVLLHMNKKAISRAIQELVAEKELTYTYTYGCTFLEPSFEKPVHITNRIVLKPPNMAYSSPSGEIVVNIESGAAFGNGTHPTTRLALEGLSYAFDDKALKEKTDALMLDIGTGSGILAIASVKMGMQGAIATDIDSCARVEAEKNIRLNGLGKNIHVQGAMAEYEGRPFALVTANLRMPTLISLRPFMKAHMETDGVLVVSGIKKDEVPIMKAAYKERGFVCPWEKDEKDWAGLVFYCGK
jgi:ribosomal protein L11 methyltransferase